MARKNWVALFSAALALAGLVAGCTPGKNSPRAKASTEAPQFKWPPVGKDASTERPHFIVSVECKPNEVDPYDYPARVKTSQERSHFVQLNIEYVPGDMSCSVRPQATKGATVLMLCADLNETVWRECVGSVKAYGFIVVLVTAPRLGGDPPPIMQHNGHLTPPPSVWTSPSP